MSVYLGTHGKIELQREFNGGSLFSTINTGDVNVTKKRFSFDFDHGQLLTGDQIEITSTDGTALDFIDSYTDSSVKKFIYVDEIDGIRLYDSFAHAVNGGSSNATTLAAPGNAIPIEVTVENAIPRLLAQVNSFEVNTERETVDTTSLSDEFRTRVNTLISGSGRMSAFWEYTGDTANELPHYMLELALRTRVGSNFKGRFYIKTDGHNPSGVAARSDDELWYQVNGVITAAAVQFAPDNTVQITADFVTTGTIEIRMNLETPDDIVQEDGSVLRLDQDAAAKLLLETDQ
tara:strand:+ start:422 stop:1291 length:870 start_codon:yes stop_codon:yes gene_type:complete